jgi:galactokinase
MKASEIGSDRMPQKIIASAPARADFLNTHQDYKGLPVVPVALNLRMSLAARPVKGDVFTIRSLDLERCDEPFEDAIEIGETIDLRQVGFFGNYFRAVLKVIAKQGLTNRVRGMDITVRSEIPIGSGLASSAALEVAFAALLNHACKLGFSNRDLAEIAFKAENEQLGIPCGRLDQYGVAHGGIIRLECKPPYKVDALPFTNLIFAVVDSGIRHSTSDIHPKRQAEINRGLKILMESQLTPQELKARLGFRFDQPKWDEISESEIENLLEDLLDNDSKRRILFTIRMERLTNLGLKILGLSRVSDQKIASILGREACDRVEHAPSSERASWILGQVMNEQHALLRDLYDLSLPLIEDMFSAALEAGAYGAKISGAGMGGSIIALVEDEESGQMVVDACLSAGAKAGWISRVGQGVNVQSSSEKP